MLDESATRDRIVAAALRLAVVKGWRRLGLDEIAREAGVGLADMQAEFATKTAILEAFSRAADRAVLRGLAPPSVGDGARDRLFDVLMTRFEVLAPHKPALRRIHADFRASPLLAAGLCGSALKTHYWMLTAAGARADGLRGCLRLPEVMAVYQRVLPVWLGEEDAGLPRTMAALDRDLRRAERAVGFVEAVCADLDRLLRALAPRRRAAGDAGAEAAPEPPPPPGPQAAPEPPRAG